MCVCVCVCVCERERERERERENILLAKVVKSYCKNSSLACAIKIVLMKAYDLVRLSAASFLTAWLLLYPPILCLLNWKLVISLTKRFFFLFFFFFFFFFSIFRK